MPIPLFLRCGCRLLLCREMGNDMESVVLGAEGGVVGKQDGRADADWQCCVKRKRILFHRPLPMNGSLRGGNSPFGETETVSVRANDNRGKAGRFGLNAQGQ